ncbi:MAG: hypothetical protein GX762_05945 [Bacteroidales bacterium]|jgi:hypothetical protein|nr:hypothetical protein [Bacteroidales bacterium]
MNKSIRLFILVVFFVACKGESNKNTNAKSLLTMGQETELVDDIANAKPVNIKDIFLLLPNDVFLVEEISKENRALLLNHVGEDKAFDISLTPIGVCDIKNGYLNLTGSQYDWEMCYWNLKDGGKLVATNNSTEKGSEIRVFFYDDGKLTEDHNYKLGGNQNYKLTDFIDVSQLSPESLKFAEKQFAKGAYHLYYKLPQNGTSITINIDIEDLIDDDENYDIFYEASKDVMLYWKNEKWERE